MLVRTGMYYFEVSRTAMYRVRYVLARTSTYCRVLPCTRCTGFQMVYMSGIFRHIPGICQPISHTRYMSRICLTYSFRVISRLCLEYSRHIPRIFFPSHLVICLECAWIIPLLANQPPEAMRLECACTQILGVKGV